jgi:hypothetical protein
MRIPSTLHLLSPLVLLGFAGPAAALQEPAADGWNWRIAPYLWTTKIDGSLTTTNADVDFDVDFSDIWDNLESAGLILVETSRGQVTLLGDIIYLGLEVDGETQGGADADIELDTTILDFAGLYRLSATSPFELGGGVRYADIESEVEVGPASSDGSHDAFDGFAAGRATWPFAERWSARLYGDIGAGDSDLVWQVSAMLGLQFERWGLGFGYRVLDYDFEDGSDELDLTFEGLVYGVEFRF